MSEIYRLFENMQEVALVLDDQGGVHFGNGAAGLLLDVPVRKLKGGKPLSSFVEFSPGFLEDGQSLAQVDEPTQSREVAFTTVEGKTGSAQISVQAFPAQLQAAFGSADERRLILYLRDVSLEKVLHSKYKGELDQKEAVIEDLRAARTELENYSKNLEKMVEERTAELRESNRLLATVLDSLGQGIFVFDRQGVCLPFYSKICLDMFGMKPGGQPVAAVLGLGESEKATFLKWIEAVFSEMLDFTDLVPLGPSRLSRGDERHIAFDYHPMRGDRRDLQGVVLVATDKTEEMKAKREAERERSYAKRIVQIVQHRQQFRLFAAEAMRICDQLVNDLEASGLIDGESMARNLHTIKGGAASFSLAEIAERAHLAEDALSERLQQNNRGDAWPVELRERLMDAALEIRRDLEEFLGKHEFLTGGPLVRPERIVEIPVSTLVEWHDRALNPRSASALGQEILASWIQEPASNAFQHVDGAMKDLATSLGKKLKPLRIENDVRVLPEAYADLFSTFIHAFRNAVDHGIETPDERVAAGKDPEGQISLRFESLEEEGQRRLKCEIRDDGRGINPARIRERLAEKGIPFDVASTDAEIIQFVFRDDFSTAASVNSVSGRGVGLSAIRALAVKMGGDAIIHSTLGQGSVMTITVPDLSEAPEISLRTGFMKVG